MRKWLCVCLALSACTAVPATVSVDRAIVEGTIDRSDAAVVMWWAHNPGDPTGFVCTAEIVSPHVVITAGHCVVGTGSVFEVYLDTTGFGGPPSAEVVLDEVHVHPDYSVGSDGVPTQGDLAVGIARGGFSVPPLSYNHTPLSTSSVGRSVRVVGYGITSATDSLHQTAGTRRQSTMTVAGIDGRLITLTSSDGNTCEGDSGGPAILPIAGNDAIVGVTSFGVSACQPAAGGTDTNVAAYVDFIDQYVDALDPPQPRKIGDACAINRDCMGDVCARVGGKSFCSAACDPAAKDTCPKGYACTDIDGATFCAPPRSGCDVGAGAPTGLAALLAVVAAALVRRRKSTI
jgi:MYXO-CTERM domain-containing protein